LQDFKQSDSFKEKILDMLTRAITAINDLVWGVPMLILILGAGIFLQLRLKFMPLTRLGLAFSLVWKGRKPHEQAKGEISPFAALMTAMAATVGTGNIAGVATAVALGGPGALFWMWMTALVGMATKYAEVLLAVHYRQTNSQGQQEGGPMFAIKNGLKRHWHWLGTAFAIFGGLAGFGIGNMVQANSVAQAMQTTFGVNPWISGVVMMVLTGFVLLGGVKRIGAVAEKLVPFMCLAYVLAAGLILLFNIGQVPAAIALVFSHAFNPAAATGGFAGAAVMLAMRYGVARGIFSNEAGLGTAGIAQAAGQSRNAVESGLIGMTGTFIDTIVVCTMTGLVLLVTGAWDSGLKGAALSSSAFGIGLPGIGPYILTLSLAVFAYTTILGWAYYGEKCWSFLAGSAIEKPYRVLWTLFVLIGAITQLDFVWLVADTLNAFMAVPNLVSLFLLSPIIVKLTREYFKPASAAIDAAEAAGAVSSTESR
jgi:alanine or glycine:cation symporter, AGCS family